MIYNFTETNYDGLLNAVKSYWVGKVPDNMKIVELNDVSANVPFINSYISDESGILVETNGSNLPCIMSLISWQNDKLILDYLDLVKSFHPQARISSTYYMKCGGYMAWHTNRGESPAVPNRLYATYNDVEGSVFKYSKNGEVFTILEPIGWYIKIFSTDVEFPHCLYSNGNRWSLGMRF